MTQASSTGIGFGLAFLASTCLIELAPAIERDLVHAVPEKTLAAILIEAGSGERSGSALGLLATGLKQAGRIGLLSGMDDSATPEPIHELRGRKRDSGGLRLARAVSIDRHTPAQVGRHRLGTDR